MFSSQVMSMASHAYDEMINPMRVRHVNGQLVDVISGEIYPACVNIHDGKVLHIERKVSAPERYILPGLIDAHVHVESSLLTPYRFAEIAVPHGTVAVVTSPHEIANVMGMDGLRFMIEDGKGTPLRFYFTAPSNVPPTAMETSGGVIGWHEVRDLLASRDFVGLGEVMDPQAVLDQDPEIMSKIEVTVQSGKRVDGHCPGLRGYDLDRYIMAGISSDHECVDVDEVREKDHKGMTIMVREGSGARNLADLLSFAKEHRHLLVTDDLRASDLLDGHLDALLRKAVAMGMDPLQAIRAVTLWPAQHYKLPGGSLYLDGPADMTVVSDLGSFTVLETWIGGELMARDGISLFTGIPKTAPSKVRDVRLSEEELWVHHAGPVVTVRVIEALPDQVMSRAGRAELVTEGGVIAPDPSRDVLVMAVVNRYAPSPPGVAFVTGFGIGRGAMASSVAHDTHNLIGVGATYRDLARALTEVAFQGGGLYAFDGVSEVRLELPVGGLMSPLPGREVAAREDELTALLRGVGCSLPAPFVTLSFQSLLTVPFLKLGDRGLVDTVRKEFASVVEGAPTPVAVIDRSP